MAGTTAPGGERGVAAPRGLGVAWAAVLILGILGMHAFVQHGAGHAGGSETTAAVAGTADHALHGPPQEPGHGEDEPGDSVVMLCAAMLLGGGAALVLLLGLRRGWPRGWLLRRTPISPLARPPQPLGAGPPYVVAFAVVRC